MDPEFFKSVPIIGQVLRFIEGLDARVERNSAHAQETLLAMIDAATETEKYEAFRDANRGARDKQREIELSGRWRQASVYVRGYDADLADRLMIKGEYWMNPENWTGAEISDARIGLRTVMEHGNRLLKYRLKDRS